MSEKLPVDPTAPSPFAMCPVRTTEGVVTVPCEPIDDALAITAVFKMGELGESIVTGGFVITHRLTGMAVTSGHGCVECCRSAGRVLVATGIDWSAITPDNVAGVSKLWPAGTSKAVTMARATGWACKSQACLPWPIRTSPAKDLAGQPAT